MRLSASGNAPARLPLVIVDKIKGAARIVALSPDAKGAGLSAGLTLADARARIPDLWVEEADYPSDAALLERIAEDCDRFTPTVVSDAPDGLLLDITGCAHLLGGEDELRRAFRDRLKRTGFHVRAVIASAPDTARALVRFGRAGIVAEGEERQVVKSLPVVALGLEDDDRIAFIRAGLKTIGSLVDRPSLSLASRFGEEMTLRLRRVLGEAEPPLAPRRPTPALWVERLFHEPIARVEDIEAVLSELGQEAVVRLAERREGGRVFEASLFRTDGAVRRVVIETGRAMRDTKALQRLFRERMDSIADPIDPGFGFDLVRLAVPVTEPLETIQSGLDGKAIEREEMDRLVDRLATRFGADRVARFMVEDMHDPMRASRAVPAIHNSGASPWPTPHEGEPPLRPLQVFDPPQGITVVAEVPDGPPRIFRWRHTQHVIRRAEGPERIAPEWWRNPGAETCDYYRVEDDGGRRFWLFRAGFYGKVQIPRWYVHGLFP